jgi:diacylglycerol kinase
MFQYGLNGIRVAWRNSRLNLLSLFAILTGILSFLLKINIIEQIIVLICIVIVFTLEMVNTSIEIICDMIDYHYNEKIRMVKDISAGAVLVSAIGSGVIGLLIFIPRLVNLVC